MGLQLIFAVETNKKCNSDWIYIKDTIEHFYSYERTQVKFSVVYMDGKTFGTWVQTWGMNFPMAICYQMFYCGPLVRLIFRTIFREKKTA